MTSDWIKLCDSTSHSVHGTGKFTGKICLQQVEILLREYNFALVSATTDQNQILVGCKKVPSNNLQESDQDRVD